MTGRREAVDLDEIPGLLGLAGCAAGPSASRPSASGSSEPGATASGGEEWSTAHVEARYRDPRIKVAGFGGQGVLFLGAVIAEAGMHSGRAVSWLPSYGPEMRGGTAHCHVILDEGEVDSPLVSRASVLFAFNAPSLQRFAEDVVPGGLVVYDSGLIPDAPPLHGREVIALPATAIAERLGSARMANMVALGAWIERTRILPLSAVRAALAGLKLKPEVVDLNVKALQEGMRFRP